jgi:DnaK suppressor protein
MQTYDDSMAARFSQLLDQREVELRAILRASGHPLAGAGEDAPHEVMDFKDVAEEQTQAAVDASTTDHAALELEQVLAARQRIHDHSYGQCLDCGNDVDLRRLTTLPAAPFCTACQARREQPQARQH